jgi:hypothetical protein
MQQFARDFVPSQLDEDSGGLSARASSARADDSSLKFLCTLVQNLL